MPDQELQSALDRITELEQNVGDLRGLVTADWMSGRAIFTRSLEAAGKFALHDLTADQITADKNNYNTQGNAVLRLSSDASRNITGLAGGEKGRVLVIINVGSFNIVFKDQSSSSDAANRIATHSSSDVTLKPEQAAFFTYDITAARWLLLFTSSVTANVPNGALGNYSGATVIGLATDGTYIFTCSTVGTLDIELLRLRSISGGLVSDSGSTSTTIWILNANYSLGADFDVLGAYIYMWAQKTADTNWYLLRIEMATGTVTEMTISGTAPTQAKESVCSDGTFLYIGESGTTTLKKYSVSGTTATYVSTITLPANLSNGICTNGTNIWFCTTTNIYKTDMTGSTVTNRKLKESDYASPLGLCIFNGNVIINVRVRLSPDLNTLLYNYIIPVDTV